MAINNALIVDDSKSARAVLKRMLTELELHVDAVESANAALSFLESQTPDVIFMDHMMPGMDGFEAVKRIKSDAKTATIPIMMYTSRGGEVYLSQAKALGAVGVIPKTISPVGLKEALFKLGLVKDRRVATADKLEPGQVERRKPVDNQKEAKLSAMKAETRRMQSAPSENTVTRPETTSSNCAQTEAKSSSATKQSLPPDSKQKPQVEASLLRKQYEHDSYIEDLRKMMDDQTIELHKSMWLGIETVSHEIFNRLNAELQEKIDSIQSGEQAAESTTRSVSSGKISWPFLVIATLLLASLILNVTLLSSVNQDEKEKVTNAVESENNVSPTVENSTALVESATDINLPSDANNLEAFVLWAHNREIDYPYDELALNENRLPIIEELISKAEKAGYTGDIMLQTHVGRFCMDRDQDGSYSLASGDKPVTQCDYVGNYVQPYDVSTTHQSLAFANYLSDLGSLRNRGINVEVNSMSRSEELSKYPVQSVKTTVDEWNLAAKLNNRVTIKLQPEVSN